MTTRPVLTVGLALLLGACTSATTNSTGKTAAASPTISPSAIGRTTEAARPGGVPGCRPSTPVRRSGTRPPEVQGTASRGELWGLLFLTGDSIRVGDEVKIVWRMTGRGALHLTATAPDGKREPLQWGPEPHEGSNYQRPGDEWGAGYRFTKAGCWTLHAARNDTSADVWVTVS